MTTICQWCEQVPATAAVRWGMTKPSVTRQVARLCDDCRLKVFESMRDALAAGVGHYTNLPLDRLSEL